MKERKDKEEKRREGMREGDGKGEMEREGRELGDGVVAGAAPGMATADAFEGEPCATDDAVLHDGFYRVGAAGGGEAARRRKQGGDAELVEADGEDEEVAHGFGGLKGWEAFGSGSFLRVIKGFKGIRAFNDAGMGGGKTWEFLRVLKVFKDIRGFNDAGNGGRKAFGIFEGRMSEKRAIKEGAGGVIGEGGMKMGLKGTEGE